MKGFERLFSVCDGAGALSDKVKRIFSSLSCCESRCFIPAIESKPEDSLEGLRALQMWSRVWKAACIQIMKVGHANLYGNSFWIQLSLLL